MTIKKALLLGGSGFVGSHITHLLTDAGVLVTIPTRRRERTKALITLPGVEMVQADIHDEDTLANLMVGQDVVINLVGVLHSDPALPYGPAFARAHVEFPATVVAAAKRAGVRRVLHMGALRSSPDAPSEYLKSKAAGEAIILAAQGDLDVTVFRPSVIFGTGDSFLSAFAAMLKNLPLFPVGCPDARFQPVYVEDVAKAFVAAIEDVTTYGKAYDLAGPKAYSLRQLIEYVGELTGHPRRVVALPEGLAYLQAGVLSLLPKPLMSPDNLRSMQIDSVYQEGDSKPAGWQPTALESVAPFYLGVQTPRSALDDYRRRAGR